MAELYFPKNNVIKLEHQPQFPKSDLSDNNANMLPHILNSSEGLVAQGDHLRPYQGYIHLIADYALKLSGVKTRYSEDELISFSQGFASFETINLMVHPPRIYDIHTARKKVTKLFMPPQLDPFELEVSKILGTADSYQAEQAIFTPEIELAERQQDWSQKLPNTFDVIVDLGDKRHETMEQIHARTAGAHIAYQLATEDLDVT